MPDCVGEHGALLRVEREAGGTDSVASPVRRDQGRAPGTGSTAAGENKPARVAIAREDAAKHRLRLSGSGPDEEQCEGEGQPAHAPRIGVPFQTRLSITPINANAF